MTLKKDLKISIQIILLFTTAIALSFIPDYLHLFFGDWYCNGSGAAILIPKTDISYSHYEYSGCLYNTSKHSAQWHWGYRHWLFLFMGISLAIVQIVKIIKTISEE